MGDPSQYTADFWGVEDGLPRHSVTALTQSTDGYLWIGMFDGIARFNGTSFRVFDQHSVDVLRSHSIRSMHADHLGTVWFGTAGGGLTKHQEGRFVTYHTEDFDIASNYIGAVLVNEEGHVFIGSSGNGISLFRDGEVIAYNASGQYPSLRAVSTLFQDRFGRIWAGTDGGVLQWVDDKDWSLSEGQPWIVVTSEISTTKVWKRLSASSGIPIGKAVMIDEMPDGRLVVLFDDGKLFQERMPGDGTFEQVVDLRDQFPEKTDWIATRSMAIESDGTLWVGDQGAGLFRIVQGVAEPFRMDGLPVVEKVWALLVDQEGHVWVGGRSVGLIRLRRRVFQNYTKDHGLGGNAVTSVLEDDDQRIWISTSAGGISVIDGDFVKLYPHPGLNQDAGITCLLERTPGDVWVGTYGAGLFCISEEGHRPSVNVELPSALVSDGMIYSLIQDGAGGLFVGTWGQHIYHMPQSGPPVRMVDDIENRTVLTRVMAVDHEGTLWSGGKYGLLRHPPGQKPVAITPDFGLPDCEIYSLFVDADGVLWVGTYGEGLFFLQSGHFIRFRLGESFVDNTVSSIVEDDYGFLWLGTYTGVRRAVRDHLINGGKPEWSYFGKLDGLGSYELAGGHQSTVLKASDGRLWFGTTHGLAVVDPSSLVDASTQSKPVIEKLVVDGDLMNDRIQGPEETLRDESKLHVPECDKIWIDAFAPEGLQRAPVLCRSSNHQYEFHIGAIQFFRTESVSFRYRLLGMDDDWREIGRQRTVMLYDLPPGKYVFEIAARSVLPSWSEETASVTLIVSPQLWETLPFRVATICLLGCSVFFGGRYVSQRRLRLQLAEASAQKRLSEDRSRISETLHDDLGANLTQMALLCDATRRDESLSEKTKDQTRRIASLARQSMRRLDEIVWAVNPGNDQLQHLVDYLCSYADEFFESSDTKVRFQLPDQMDSTGWPAKDRLEIFLAFKECLNNVAKNAEATVVTIRLEIEKGFWMLRVQDNGKGMEPDFNEGGHGLGNMARRMERMGGRCDVVSLEGEGTIVTFTLPKPGGKEKTNQ